MLRKLALAVGAVTLCGAVQAQAGFSFGPGQNGDQHGPNQHDDGPSFKDPHGDQPKAGNFYNGDKGDACGCLKIILPEFDSTCDVVKWIETLDSQENRDNVFDNLVNGHGPKDPGFYLPKSEIKILADIQSDIKDVEKDFEKLTKDNKGYGNNAHGPKFDPKSGKNGGEDWQTKELRADITCDLTDIRHDICDFASGLKYCHHDHDCTNPGNTPSTSAVPLPAAASQGLIGLGLVGCLSLFGAVRRRVIGLA
jgi:hypothetical protein